MCVISLAQDAGCASSAGCCCSSETGNRHILEFFQQFDLFANLVIVRALLLNRTTIFCKICGPQVKVIDQANTDSGVLGESSGDLPA